MVTIEVRCKVKLPEAIVLSTQRDTTYGAMRWELANTDTVSVEMDVSTEKMKASYQEHSSKGNWYVNSRVEVLRLLLTLNHVSTDDLDRLYARHPSGATFTAHLVTSSGVGVDQPYQEAPELGLRVVREIRETVNLALQFIRGNYGQHWLRLLSDGEGVQNFLDDAQAEWRETKNRWTRLVVGHLVVAIGGLCLGAANLYLEIADWHAVQQAVAANERPSDGFALLSDSRERYHQGDVRIAIIHLNSALCQMGSKPSVRRHVGVALRPAGPRPLDRG